MKIAPWRSPRRYGRSDPPSSPFAKHASSCSRQVNQLGGLVPREGRVNEHHQYPAVVGATGGVTSLRVLLRAQPCFRLPLNWPDFDKITLTVLVL